MDRLDAIATFVAVADAGGFSAAARRLGTPLATVSRKVSELEAQMRVRLLNRTTRRVVLTEAGHDFAASARAILEALREAERRAAGEYAMPRGRLTIAAPILFGRLHVVPVVTGFLRAFPDVEVALRLSDRVADLIAEGIDVAVRIGTLADSTLVARRLGGISQIVVASPDYLAMRGTPRDPAELAGHDCIATGDDGPAEWPLGARPVPIRARLRVTTSEAALDATLSGFGLARLRSYQVAAPLRAGRLVRVLAAWEPAPEPLSLIHQGTRLMPAKLRAFLDFGGDRIAERVA